VIRFKIIQKCKAGKRSAYKELYDVCVPYVYSIVSRYISNTEDRKDLIQEIFAKVFTKIESYDENKGQFKSWIRKIAVNECLMFIRSKSKMSIHVINENYDITDTTFNRLENLTREDILNMLDKMPKRYKLVFMAYIIDGFSHKEIADKLKITKDTSRSQLTRAKRWIIKNISKETQIKKYGLF
jgi:RNA polymerase sigma-70 factor (ECF subfamily)